MALCRGGRLRCGDIPSRSAGSCPLCPGGVHGARAVWLDLLPAVAVTNDHKLVAQNNANVSFYGSGDQESQTSHRTHSRLFLEFLGPEAPVTSSLGGNAVSPFLNERVRDHPYLVLCLAAPAGVTSTT